MVRTCAILLVMLAVAAVALPVTAAAQGDEAITAVALDDTTFVTVRETTAGDVVSLYRVRGDRIVLVDTVVNSSNRDSSLPKRYLHRLALENR